MSELQLLLECRLPKDQTDYLLFRLNTTAVFEASEGCYGDILWYVVFKFNVLLQQSLGCCKRSLIHTSLKASIKKATEGFISWGGKNCVLIGMGIFNKNK